MNIKDYQKRLGHECLTESSINHYVREAAMVERMLAEGNRCTDPKKIGPEDVMYLLEFFKSHDLAVKTRKGYIASLKKWCKVYGNPKVPDWPRIRLPPDTRPNVDWLTPDQVKIILSAELTKLEKVAIHLELCLGLRRVEAIRLRVHDVDFEEKLIYVRGKGALGGKPRIVPFTAGTDQIIGDWLAERDKWVTACHAIYPKSAEIPDELIVYRRAGRIYPYRESGKGYSDALTKKVSKRIGIDFANHTLRRTFGRALYRSGVPVPTISKILGHDSTDVTLGYLGVDLDDMRDAISNFKMI